MSNLTPEQLRELYQNLPPDVKEAYFSVDTAEILQNIGKENNLNTAQTGIMIDETGLLMLGLTHPNEFISNLAERMKIERVSAGKIAHKINDEIFTKIRESLRKIHEPGWKKPDKPRVAVKQESKVPPLIKPQKTFAETQTKPLADMEEKIIKKAPAEAPKDIFEERNKMFVSRTEKKTYTEIDPYREQI